MCKVCIHPSELNSHEACTLQHCSHISARTTHAVLHPPAAAVVPAPPATATRPKLAMVRVVATVPTKMAVVIPAQHWNIKPELMQNSSEHMRPLPAMTAKKMLPKATVAMRPRALTENRARPAVEYNSADSIACTQSASLCN